MKTIWAFPLSEAVPARSTSYGGASTGLLPHAPCLAPPPQLSGSRQAAGWHHGPVEVGVPRIKLKSCTFSSWILELNCRVESRFHITKPRVSSKIVIFGLLFQDLKNDHLSQNPRFCDVESRFPQHIWGWNSQTRLYMELILNDVSYDFTNRDCNVAKTLDCDVVSRNHMIPRLCANETAWSPDYVQTKPHDPQTMCKRNRMIPRLCANETAWSPDYVQTKPHHSNILGTKPHHTKHLAN